MSLWLVLVLALQLSAFAPSLKEVERHASVVREFQQLTGYPNGRPGFVADHLVPLCAGGEDAVRNLQWQTQADSYRKDVFERALCKAMKAQGYKLVKE